MNPTIISCRICGQLQRVEPLPAGEAAECARCGTLVMKARRHSLGRTAALSLAALVLYVPANIYPIMRMEFHGIYTQATVWDGCSKLFQDGQWPIAIIVFLASLLIPLLKLIGLFFLDLTATYHSSRFQPVRTRIYKILEVIGPWAMLDVFLMAILVALVKLGRVATVTPGPGLLAFCSVVVLTILASASFEPRLIWEPSQRTS